MKTIVVAGGAGFVGTNLVRGLLRRKNTRVVVIDRLSRSDNLWNLADLPRKQNLEFFRADVAARPQMSSLLAEFRPDAVINCAADTNTSISTSSPARYVDGNIVTTVELLEAIRWYLDSGRGMRADFKYIHVSSCEDFAIDGDSQLSRPGPTTPYAASKAAADQMVNSWQHTYQIPACIASFGNCFGPYQSAEEPIPFIILNLVTGRYVRVSGADLHGGEWVAINDVSSGLMMIADQGQFGGRYTFSSGIVLNSAEIALQTALALDEVLPVAENRASGIEGIGSYSELLKFEGFSPKNSELKGQHWDRFRNSLIEAVRWYISNISRIRLGDQSAQGVETTVRREAHG